MEMREFCLWLDKYLDRDDKNMYEIQSKLDTVDIYDVPTEIKGFIPPQSGQAPNMRVH